MKTLAVLALIASLNFTPPTVPKPAMEAAPPATVKAQTLEMVDGSKLIQEGDVIYMTKPDGKRVTAPNGPHTLTDGHVLITVDGKIVPRKSSE